MIFPSKLTQFQETTLKKSIYILKNIPNDGIKILVLYKLLEKKFDSILEYQEALDLLFCLDKIVLKGDMLCLSK